MSDDRNSPPNPLLVLTSNKYPHRGCTYSAEEEREAEEERRKQNLVAVQTSTFNTSGTWVDQKVLQRYSGPANLAVIPRFTGYTNYQNFSFTAFSKRRLVLERSRYITDLYEEKKKQLSRKIKNLYDSLWKVEVPLNKRVGYANFVNLVISFTELFYGADSLIDDVTKAGFHSFMTCDLIDGFDAYYKMLKKCQTVGAATPLNFSGLLDLRDIVVTAMRDHILVALPIKENRQMDEYRREYAGNYQPYDYEWLASAAAPENEQLTFMKYVASSRRNQAELSSFRASIIATHDDPEFKILREVKCPFPKKAKNAEGLDYALHCRTNSTRLDFLRAYRIAKGDKIKESPHLLFALRVEQFNEIGEAMRVQKNRLMARISECNSATVKPKLRMLGALASIESLMLILSRVFGMYFNVKHGLLGETVPGPVLIALRNAMRAIKEPLFYKSHLDENVEKKLEILRAKIRTAVYKFYTEKESSCHDHIQRSELDSLETYDYDTDVEEKDIDDALGHHKRRMVFHMLMQKYELCRLSRELYYAQEVPKSPSSNSTEKFCISTVKGTFAFSCNISEVVEESVMQKLNADAKRLFGFDLPQDHCGLECYREVKFLAEHYKIVPHRVELEVNMIKELTAEIGMQTVNGSPAKELARRLARQINLCVDAHNLPEKFERKISNQVATHAARRVIKLYMQYLNENMDEPPTRVRSRDPSPVDSSFQERIPRSREEGKKSDEPEPEDEEKPNEINEEENVSDSEFSDVSDEDEESIVSEED